MSVARHRAASWSPALVLVAGVSIPVVAAGGVATAEDVAEAIGAGAAAVRVGTRFVATAESGAHPAYVVALLSARSAQDTMLTTAFGGGWPDAPHRVLRSAVAAAEAFDGDVVAHVVADGQRRPVARFSSATPSRNVEGNVAAMALYAGEGVGDIYDVQPPRRGRRGSRRQACLRTADRRWRNVAARLAAAEGNTGPAAHATSSPRHRPAGREAVPSAIAPAR